MITQYTKPIENPYVPQPWDMISTMQTKKQSLIAGNEALRQQYANQTEAMRQKFEMYNMERNERKQESALADMEESSLFLSQMKAYGQKDNQRLNQIRQHYTDRINDAVTKYSDNPFKLAAFTRGLKNAVKQDVMGGDLYAINDRAKKAERMDQIVDDMRMRGAFDDDYYIAQKQNLFSPVGKTPDLQGEALNFAKSIPSDSPYISSVQDLTKVIYQNMVNQFQDDIQVRKRAGKTDAQIQQMYLGIANAAANSQWEMEKQSGRSRGSGKSQDISLNSTRNLVSLPAVTDPGYKSKGDIAVRKPQYTPFDVDNIDKMTKYIKANGANLTFIDAETLKPSLGKDVMGTATDDKEVVYAAGTVAPGSINLGRIANNPNFVSPMVVSVGNKQYYVERPLSPQQTAWANDVNNISEAIYHPDGYEFTTSAGHTASASMKQDKSGRPIYTLNVMGTPFTGYSPDEVYKQYLPYTKPR